MTKRVKKPLVPLSERQQSVLNFIATYIEAQGFSPAYQEILEATGLKSLSSVANQVSNLTRYGYLKRNPGRFRALSVVELSGSPSNPQPTTLVPQIVIDRIERLIWADPVSRVDLNSARSIREGIDELRVAFGLTGDS